MAKRSFLDCPHHNVQQFTECCLDCGYNIYTTQAEYEADLAAQLRAQRQDASTKRIRAMERQLGYNVEDDPDDWYPNKYPDM